MKNIIFILIIFFWGCQSKTDSSKEKPNIGIKEVNTLKHDPCLSPVKKLSTTKADNLKDKRLQKYYQQLTSILDSIPLAMGLRKNINNRGYVGVTYSIKKVIISSNTCELGIEEVVEKWLAEPLNIKEKKLEVYFLKDNSNQKLHSSLIYWTPKKGDSLTSIAIAGEIRKLVQNQDYKSFKFSAKNVAMEIRGYISINPKNRESVVFIAKAARALR